MSQPAILIVEDEKKLSRVLQLEFTYENYQTQVAENGTDALRLIEENHWDVILLDIMLPELSGLEVFAAGKTIRSANTNYSIDCT